MHCNVLHCNVLVQNVLKFYAQQAKSTLSGRLIVNTFKYHLPFWGTMDPINAFDPVWDLPGTTFWYLGWCNVVRWSVLIACIPFQSCSTLFQPFWGTMDHLNPINAVFDPFDPVWDLPETTFGHLGWCNVVRMVSPDCLYTVPILFHLVPAIWGHHGPMDPINAVLGHF